MLAAVMRHPRFVLAMLVLLTPGLLWAMYVSRPVFLKIDGVNSCTWQNGHTVLHTTANEFITYPMVLPHFMLQDFLQKMAREGKCVDGY